MPIFNTEIYKSQAHPVVGGAITSLLSRNGDSNVVSGDVQFAFIKYVLTGSEAQADTINLCVLPAGVIPLPQLSSVTASADPTTSGNTLTLNIGTNNVTGDADGWAAAINLANGGQVACTSATMPAWIEPTPLAADANSGNAVVFATLATANGSPDANDILYFTLAYKRAK